MHIWNEGSTDESLSPSYAFHTKSKFQVHGENSMHIHLFVYRQIRGRGGACVSATHCSIGSFLLRVFSPLLVNI